MADIVADGRPQNWFWLDNVFMDEYAAKIGPVAVCVYAALARHCDKERRCFPSFKHLARECGLARTSVQSAINRLVEHQLIRVEPRRNQTNDAIISNVYTLLPLYQQMVQAIPANGIGLYQHVVQPIPPNGTPLYQQMAYPIPPDGTEVDSCNKTQLEQDPCKDSPPTPPSGGIAPTPRKRGDRTPPRTGDVWNAYAAAYERRYKVPPARNAMVNGQLAQFLQRIPCCDAPHVAAFYVDSNNAYYIRKGHSVGALLADAEKLHTEWRTGRRGTERQAREEDRLQGTGDMWRQLIEEAKAQEQNERSNH